MTQPANKDRALSESLISAIAVGGFLIILGVVFGLTPGVWKNTLDFFWDFSVKGFPFAEGTIVFPVPAHPASHFEFYNAIFYFAVGVGVLQAAILASRLYVHSRIRRIAETVGHLVFWFGVALAVQVWLMEGTLEGWFAFWAALIIVFGVSLVARGLIHFAASLKRNRSALTA
jgi:hypothetical protein